MQSLFGELFWTICLYIASSKCGKFVHRAHFRFLPLERSVSLSLLAFCAPARCQVLWQNEVLSLAMCDILLVRLGFSYVKTARSVSHGHTHLNFGMQDWFSMSVSVPALSRVPG